MADITIYSMADLERLYAERKAEHAPRHGKRYGQWVVNLNTPVSLDFYRGEIPDPWVPYDEDGPSSYQVRLDELHTPAGLAHWLTHLSQKSWFTPEVCGQFVQACMHLTDFCYYKGGNWSHNRKRNFVQPWKTERKARVQ